MTIEEIYYSKSLSVRAYNICNNNLLRDLTTILNHYSEFKTFMNIRNCGIRTNEELIEFCKKNFQVEILEKTNKEDITIENKFTTIISNLTRSQREVVNSFIEISINKLSNRSKNIMNSLLNEDLKINNLYEKFLKNTNFNFKDIKNSGTRTEIELNQMLLKIIKFLEETFNNKNINEIKASKNKFLLEKFFPHFKLNNENIDVSSIFKIIDFLIFKNVIFEKHTSIVFKKSFKIYLNQTTLTTLEIANELNITNERVRQLRKVFLIKIFEYFQFIKNIDDDLYQKYGIDINQNYIMIDDYLSSKINNFNKTNFSLEFNTFLIYFFYCEQLNILGNIEDVLEVKHFNSVKNRHKWSRFYLINNTIYDVFDFNAFVEDISNRLLEKIEETYSFHFETYLLNFFKVKEDKFKAEISIIAEEILFQEFELVIEQHDCLIFKQNTIKHISQYAIEALEKLGVPSKLESIFKIIDDDFPKITKSKDALRGTLNRTPEFIFFGRSSTYGLKKWEIEKEGIKGGTIRDIIYEYLEEKNVPVHIFEILIEVSRYRSNTNAKSILTNLKLDSQKKFVFFNQNFIGLSYKNYSTNLTNLPKFLGRNIMLFIKNNRSKNRSTIENHFSKKLKISIENISHILDLMIEDGYIFMNSKKILHYED